MLTSGNIKENLIDGGEREGQMKRRGEGKWMRNLIFANVVTRNDDLKEILLALIFVEKFSLLSKYF